MHLTLGIPIRCAVGTATGFVGASALALWVPGLGMAGWTILALAVAVFTLTTTWELVAQRVVSKRRVLVVGPTATAAEIAEVIQLEGGLPFVVVGAVDDEPGDTARLGSIAELSRIIDELRPDLIVLTDGESSARALDRLLAAPTDGIKVIGLAHFFDHAFGRIPLDGADADVVHEHPPRLAPPVHAAREADIRHRQRLVRSAPERAALAGDRALRPDEPRARDLPPDAGRRGREALHHAEVPHDAGRRRGRAARPTPRSATRG